jgi:lysophospholipase L1-like esterase
MFDLLGPEGPLYLASETGLVFADDSLACVVQGGAVRDAESQIVTYDETLFFSRERCVPGNRSTYARVRFRCDSPDVTVELRLVQTLRPVHNQRLTPLCARLERGCFTLTGLHDDVLAGDPTTPVFAPTPGTWHTLELLTFQKSTLARVSGCPTVLKKPDHLRFLPGTPGLRVIAPRGAPVRLRDWLVTAVGPRDATLGAIGDSITAGLQHGPEADSYVHQVTRALGQPFTLNTGSGGATTTLDRARFAYEIAPFQPQWVWIESGTNDLTGGLRATDIFANHQAMATAVNWRGRALFSTVPPRNTDQAAANRERRALNALIRASGLPFVDRSAVVADPSNPDRLSAEFDSGDGTHLNPAGNAAVAGEAVRLLRTL